MGVGARGEVVLVGDRVPRGGYGRVVMRFRRSVAVMGGDGGMVFVVEEALGGGPRNVVVGVDPAVWVDAAGGGGGRGVDFRRFFGGGAVPIYHSGAPKLGKGGRLRLVRSLRRYLPGVTPRESVAVGAWGVGGGGGVERALGELFATGRRAMAGGDFVAVARVLRGAGPGLTPAGDDYLCGLLLALHMQKRGDISPGVLAASLGGNPFSNTFLVMAAEGRVAAAVRALLGEGWGRGIRERVRAAAAFGHTSGADFLAGLRDTLGALNGL